MPRQQKLKVYRTPIGFHDAYVAAPSQKAALQAWGSDSDLFAQKIAEQVTDPELTKEPLAKPGTIIRKLRGTADEQVQALGKGATKKAAKRPAKPKTKPKPSRAALALAEADVRDLQQRQADEIKALNAELAALKERLDDAERAHDFEMKAAQTRLDDEADRYKRAIRAWEDD